MKKKISTVSGRVRRVQNNRTLYQKVRFSILVFSLVPIIALTVFAAFFVYRQQKKEMQEEIRGEVQEVFDTMPHNMETIELIGKSIWTDTYFIPEINRAVVDGSITEYGRFVFMSQTLSVMKVVTGNSQVQAARLHLDYPQLREYPPYLYHMNRAANSLWHEDREELPSQGRWYLDVTDKQAERLYSGYFVGDDMAAYVLPININSKLTGVFEIVIPIRDIVLGKYGRHSVGGTFLVDSDGRIFDIDGNSGFNGITVSDIEKIGGWILAAETGRTASKSAREGMDKFRERSVRGNACQDGEGLRDLPRTFHQLHHG